MIPALNNYLHQHHRLSIPGIGTIYIERTPARSDFTNRQILPPGLHYRFDRVFDTPDKQLFAFIARENNVADYEAIRMYNDWAADLSAKVKIEEDTQLDGIGLLRRNGNGDIIFEALAPIDAYLTAVSANRILRTNSSHNMLVGDRETTTLEMSGYLNESDKSNNARSNWWIYALIIGALGLIVLFLYLYKN
ncbi:MAG: hypothetical protein EOO02_00810 [Chitinophagaceae bacterium]|nr:MAG: hypothetical protein EOO02_00810 [Chitinophagaceae bacterium]